MPKLELEFDELISKVTLLGPAPLPSLSPPPIPDGVSVGISLVLSSEAPDGGDVTLALTSLAFEKYDDSWIKVFKAANL